MTSKTPKFTLEKMKVGDAVSEAYSELISLGEEMREAFDNTPESLQQSDAGQRREAAADALESLSEPWSYPKIYELDGVEVVRHRMKRRGFSRAARRDHAVEMMHAVIDRLLELIEDDGTSSELRDEAESLSQDLETLIDEAEGVDFPGMYG